MGAGPTYIVVEGKTFQKEELTLDNHVYKNCTLEHCRIYYSGGPYELIDTHILESELILNQPAKNIYSAIQIFKMKSPGSLAMSMASPSSSVSPTSALSPAISSRLPPR